MKGQKKQAKASSEENVEMKGDRTSSMETFGKVMRVIGRYKILLVLSIVLAAFSVILQLYVPILFGDAIDGIIAKGRVDYDQ